MLTLAEKTEKLLGYSVIVKHSDKKTWQTLLPKMSQKQLETLYGVLVDEVRAWKNEGVSIVTDKALESSLLVGAEHGASLNALKQRLEGKTPPAQLPKIELPQTPFAKELKREVATPELPAPPIQATIEPVKSSTPKITAPAHPQHPHPVKPIHTPPAVDNAKHAWMLSNKVIAPKTTAPAIKPQPIAVPRVRNRVPKQGLADLNHIASIDDIAKIEAAHLRQGPLAGQINLIKEIITKLAQENDVFPATILPVFEQSPLFQTYLKAGSMLIERNVGNTKLILDQIMAELDSVGQDTLSQQEFEAVVDLRKELEIMSGF